MGVADQPTTNQQQAARQIRAVRVLVDLLREAHAENLPVIAWDVTPNGAALVGTCLEHDPAGQRQTFDAWASWLGLERREWPEDDGAVRLHASAQDWRRKRVAVVLRATVGGESDG